MNLSKQNLLMGLICIIYIMGVLIIETQTFSLLETYQDSIIELNEFYLDDEPDDLQYRLVNSYDNRLYTFKHRIYGGDLREISEKYSFVIIHRLSGQWYRVYFNDFLVGVVGDTERGRSNIWNSAHSFPIDHRLIERDNVLIIEVYGLYEIGKTDFPIILATPDTTNKIVSWFKIFYEDLYSFVLGILVFAFVMILSLSLISKQVKKEFLYFSLALLSMGLSLVDYMVIYYLPLSILSFKKMALFFMYLACFFTALAVYELYKKKLTLILGILSTFCIVLLMVLTRDNISFKVGYSYTNLLLMLNVIHWLILFGKTFSHKRESAILFFLHWLWAY